MAEESEESKVNNEEGEIHELEVAPEFAMAKEVESSKTTVAMIVSVVPTSPTRVFELPTSEFNVMDTMDDSVSDTTIPKD